MKRIFLFLAAVAVLVSSCMKENAFENLDGNATIKAVASGTKTLVDGASVVWENTDVIKVVYQSIGQSADFSVKGSVDGSSANFTGTVNPEWTLEDKVHPYVVYPATAVTLEEGTGSTVISHTLPEVQTGTVTSGMNLSSALLSEEDLAAGTAEAVFHNALTLLQIVVPEGVASVELSADYGLVGTAAFNVDNKDTQGAFNDEYDDDDNPIYETVYATGKLTIKTKAEKKTVTLSNGGDALEAKTHSVLVYPGNTTLALTMTGTDGATYNSSVDVALNAGEYRLIDLTKIFGVTAKSEYVVFPAGGTVEIPVTTANDYTVSLSDGADSWISYSVPSKAFHSETIVFTVAPNEGGSREATVTISSNGKTTSFKISQEEIYMDFVNDENGDPIQWEESFGVYASEADAKGELNAKATFTNVFTIGLSDDFSKGAYKIENMFAYQNKKGTTYYADYAAGELTIYVSDKAAPGRSYYFKNEEVVLIYDSSAKTFASKTTTIPAGTRYDFITANFGNKDCFLGGYSVAVKSEEPETPETPSSPYAYLFGDYTESFNDSDYYGYPSKGILTIAQSDDANYDLKMTFFGGSFAQVTVYATVSDDGKSITTTAAKSGPAFKVSTLSIEYLSMGGPIMGTVNFDTLEIYDYTASPK